MKEPKLFNWKRAFVHALEWRAIAFVEEALVAYLLTGSWHISLALASMSAAVKTFLHAVWIRIKLRHTKGKLYL